MEVRLIDIPMDGGSGMGLFEELHDIGGPGEFADHLREMAATYYGTASRAFLEKLVAARRTDPDGLTDRLKASREKFIRDHLPLGSDGQVRSVCGRFGVIASAGELAITWGALNWPDGEAERGAARCFRDWLAGGNGAGEDQKALAQVRGFFEMHGSSRFADITTYRPPTMPGLREEDSPRDSLLDTHVANRVGFRRFDKANDRWTYYVFPEAWAKQVCAGLDPKRVAEMTDASGWLEHDAGHLTKKVTIPEVGRIRVYVVSGAILAGDD
jgi:uncharacterized protein (DUF927 family)